MCFHVHVVFSVAPSISIFKYWINLTWQEQTWDEWLEQASSDHRPKSWKPIEPMKKAQLTAKKRLDAKLQNMKKPAAAKPKAKAKSSSSKTPAAKSKAKGSVAKGNWKKEKKNKKVDKKKNKKVDKKNKKELKAKKTGERVGWNAETEYGVAKRLFREQFAGQKKDFEKCWRQSDTCQRILKSMTTGELKRRRFENWLIQ